MRIKPCTNEIYSDRERTVKYSVNPKIVPYNYFRTAYDNIYGRQESHI